MERYIFNPRLPEIVSLVAAPLHGEERDLMIDRMIMMHTPTCGIVEIVPSSRLLLDDEIEELDFVFTDSKGTRADYTALLLNKELLPKAEDRSAVLNSIVKWFLDYAKEYDLIMSARPVQSM